MILFPTAAKSFHAVPLADASYIRNSLCPNMRNIWLFVGWDYGTGIDDSCRIHRQLARDNDQYDTARRRRASK